MNNYSDLENSSLFSNESAYTATSLPGSLLPEIEERNDNLVSQALFSDDILLDTSIAPKGHGVADVEGDVNIFLESIPETLYSQSADISGQESIPESVLHPIDTIAPKVTLNLQHDTGSDNQDGLTNKPSIVGQIDETFGVSSLQARISSLKSDLFVDVTPKVQPDGSFTFNREQLKILNGGRSLGYGDYVVDVQATDKAGNTSDIVSVSFHLDISHPRIHAALVNDTGSRDTDGVTTDPTITGRVKDGSPIVALQARISSLKSDLFVDVTPKLHPDGSFTFNREQLEILNGSQPLAAGHYTVDILATDKAGNNSEIFPISFTLEGERDLDAPIIHAGLANDTGISDQDGLTNDPTITGRVSDDSEIVKLQARINSLGSDLFVDVTPKLREDGHFTLDREQLKILNGGHPLGYGDYTVDILATDKAGNVSEVTPVSFKLDLSQPRIHAGLANDTGINNADGLTNNPTITGRVTDGSKIVELQARISSLHSDLFVDVTPKLHPDGSFTFNRKQLEILNGSQPLADGHYTVDILATDKAGNISEITPVSFRLDTIAPNIVLESIEDGDIIDDASQLVGTVDEDMVMLTYRLNDGEEIEVDIRDRSFSQGFDLEGIAAGENHLTFTVTDKAGNTRHLRLSVNVETQPVDTTPPEVIAALVNDTGIDDADKITADPSITGNVTDESEIASFQAGFNSNTVDITQVLQPDGGFSLNQDILAEINNDNPLPDGDYTLNLTATDTAGNVSSSFPVSFALDTTAPTISLSNLPNVNDINIQIAFSEIVTGDITNISNYTLTSNGETIDIDSVTEIDSSSVNLNLTSALNAGSYQLEITGDIQDNAGNSLDTQSLNIIIELEPVEISPFNGEEMVTLTRETIVRFGKKIDPATVTSENFYAIANGERVAGRIVVSSTEEFATLFYDEPLPQSTEVRVVVEGGTIIGRDGVALDADGDGTPGGTETSDFRTLPLTQIEGTDVFGYVYDSYNRNPDGSDIPLEGVRITLDALPGVFAVTDENGYFILENVPAPEFYVYIDGSEVVGVPEGVQYASLGKAFHSVPGQAIRLEMDGEDFDIYLPPVAESDVMQLSLTEDTDVGFGEASLALLEENFPDIDPEVWARTQVTYPAGSAQNDAGEAATQGIIVPVQPDRLPAPLPEFVEPDLVISVQAGSDAGFNREVEGGATNFDVPAPVQFPNTEGLTPGEKSLIWSFNHDAGDWEVIGTGTVSDDGLVIESDEGVGILAPGWHFTISGTRSRFEIGSKGGGAGAGDDFLSGDFPIENGTFKPNLSEQALLLDRILPDSILEFNFRNELKTVTFGEFDAVADQFVDRFIAGTGGTFLHDIGSSLSDLAKDSDTINAVFENLEMSIDNMIQMQANGGSIDNRNLSVTIPNNISFPLFDSPSLKGLIGGTQGTTIFIEDFDANATIDSPDTGGSGNYSATLRLEILDDFGVGNDDIYTPGLTAFWILQHERIGSAPFINKIVIETPIEGEFTVPPGFEDVEINISNDANLQNFQFVPENSNNEFLIDLQNIENQIANPEIVAESTIPGFGNNPQVFYKYEIENGFELTGTIDPNQSLRNFVLPPNQFFTATFYQPSTNRSTSAASVTSSSGEFSLFSDSPGGQGESDSRVNFDTFGGLDSDGDGVPDIGEEVIGTNPNSVDSDGDGISDAAELEQGLDPLGGEAFPTGIISNLPLLGEANSVVVEGSVLESGGQTAYVATGSHGLAIVDASEFNNPIVLGQLNLAGDATDVAVDSSLGIAAVATNSEGLQLVDVSDPMMPSLLQTIRISANQVGFPVTQVEVFDGIAYISAGSSIRAIDLLTGESLQNLTLPGSGTVTGMAREGTQLYTFMSGSDTFSVIDISNQGEARVTGQRNISIASTDVGVFAGNGIAYLAGSGLRTVDVSDPSNPTLISDADFFSTARNVTLNGSGLALVSAENQGVGVYDVSDPENTNNVLFTVDTPGFTNDIAIASGIAFVADDTAGLQVINYLPFDRNGQVPTVTLNSLIEDVDPDTAGIQVLEGSSVPLQVDVTDDVQVRNVELLVNGEVVSSDVSFPYDLNAIALGDNPDAETITVQARATDTGGSTAVSEILTLDLVPDTIAPTIETIIPGDGQTALENLRRVTIRFSEALDSEDIVADNFQLLDSADNLIPLEDIQLREEDSAVQLIYAALPEGEYQLVVDASQINDRAGNLLGDSNITSSFTLEPSQFIDISSTGNIVPNLIGDDLSSLIDLPFEFEFYGQTYSQAGISSNGLISLGGTNTTFTNQSLASGGSGLQGLPTIAPFWDDLETRSDEGDIATVFTEVIGSPGDRKFIIQWHQLEAYPFGSQTGDITFQAILSENTNEIQFNYLDVDFEGSTDDFQGEGRSATVGIWNSLEEFQEFSFNEPRLSNGLSLIPREEGVFES